MAGTILLLLAPAIIMISLKLLELIRAYILWGWQLWIDPHTPANKRKKKEWQEVQKLRDLLYEPGITKEEYHIRGRAYIAAGDKYFDKYRNY